MCCAGIGLVRTAFLYLTCFCRVKHEGNGFFGRNFANHKQPWLLSDTHLTSWRSTQEAQKRRITCKQWHSKKLVTLHSNRQNTRWRWSIIRKSLCTLEWIRRWTYNYPKWWEVQHLNIVLHLKTRWSDKLMIYGSLRSIIWLRYISKWENGRNAKQSALEFCWNRYALYFYFLSKSHCDCAHFTHCISIQVLEHDERNIKALYYRGMVHRRLNAPKKAKSDLQKAQKLLRNGSDPLHQAIGRELKLLSKNQQKKSRNNRRSKHKRNKNSRDEQGHKGKGSNVRLSNVKEEKESYGGNGNPERKQ